MTEAQEVAAAFIAGAAGFPALLWLAHNAERRIRIGWEKTLENMALAAEPQEWALAERYLREGTPPETGEVGQETKMETFSASISCERIPDTGVHEYRCRIFRNGEIAAEEYAVDLKTAASAVAMHLEDLCPNRRIASVEYALSAEDESEGAQAA